jgi:hypothetical protein
MTVLPFAPRSQASAPSLSSYHSAHPPQARDAGRRQADVGVAVRRGRKAQACLPLICGASG